MLKVCVNGARTPEEHPLLSADPAPLAADAAGAILAGAGAVHLHPKDSAGRDSLLPADVSRWISAFRTACPGIPLGVTTGAWSVDSAAERLEYVRNWASKPELRPDFASVNWHEEGAEELALLLLDRGIAVEAGLWTIDAAHLWAESRVREECLRALVEIHNDAVTEAEREASEIVGIIRRAAPEVPILLHGEGRTTWQSLSLARSWRLDTRIGLEDTLTLPGGTPAESNARLVQAAVALGE